MNEFSFLTRRRFLASTAATAGALAVGFPAMAAGAAGPVQWGDLKGRFVYDGKPPERKKLKVDKDVACCGKFDIRDESLMVGPDGGLANVYVYLRTRHIAVCPELERAAAKEVLLDNRDCIFKPHCMKIWYTKQEYHIVNSDPIAQTVAFSSLGEPPANIVLSPAPGNTVDAGSIADKPFPCRSTATTILGKAPGCFLWTIPTPIFRPPTGRFASPSCRSGNGSSRRGTSGPIGSIRHDGPRADSPRRSSRA